MENQQNLIDPSLMNPQPHLSTFGVLKESIKTTRRNGKLAMFILLLVFLSFSQLELSSCIAFKRILENLHPPYAEEVTSFESRPRFLVEAPLSSPRGKRTSYSQQQRAYPSSYNGYTGPTKQVHERKDYYYKRAHPSSYSGYTGQAKQADKSKVYFAYEGAYPRSYNGNSGQNKQYQRAYPSSYIRPVDRPMAYNRYTIHTKQASEHKGAYSYQRTNPSSYGYTGQTMPTGNHKHAYSYHQSYPRSYGYLGEAMEKVRLTYFWVILGLNLLFLAISCIILLFFCVATISSSYEAYTAKVLSLKDVHLKLKESWKRVVHTGICLTLISLSLLAMFALLTLFAFFSNIGGTVGSFTYVIYAILIVSGTLWYFHMAALWMISLVVSVLESDSSGLKAIRRAAELMKGKNCQAYILIMLFNPAMAGVHMISSAYMVRFESFDQWAIGIMIPFTVGLICVFKLLMFVAFTIYYHERKMNHKEEKVDGGLYLPLAFEEA